MKFKKSIFFLCALTVVLVFLAGCGNQEGTTTSPRYEDNTTEETMKPVTLKFADFLPPNHPVSVALMQGWAKRVEEVTNGLVKVDYYPAGTLLKNGDIYEGVVSGVADVGHDVSGYNIGRLPVLNAMYVGGVEYKSSKVSSNVARDLIEEIKPKELENTQLMFVYGVAPGVLMTKKPVRNLEDLQNMQIKATATNVDTLELLGAVPVGITIAETYDALSKGVVDGALLPSDTLKTYKLGEVTKYITQTSLIYNTVHYIIMNKDIWNSFPENIKNAIYKVNQEMFEIVSKGLWDEITEEGLMYAVEENGAEVITLSEEEHERWKDLLKPLQDKYVQTMNEKGIDGQSIMNKIIELSEKYNNEFHK